MAKKVFTIIIICILTFSARNYSYAAETKLYIGILPVYAPEKIWHSYKPFIDYLNKTTGLSWELKLYNNYNSIINGICSSEISIAYLGSNTFGLAYEKCKAKPLLVTLSSDGKPFFRSIIFTNNQNINSLKELKGKSFAFGDKNSTSSHIVPRKMLEDEGVTMDIIKPVFLKNHNKIINAVAYKEVEAGATKESVFEKVKDIKLKVLKISEPLPHYAFCAAPNIEPNIKTKFINALLKLRPLHNNEDRNIVKEWDSELRHGFMKPSENYIQDIMKLHMLLKRYND